jgi:hypothetical protein
MKKLLAALLTVGLSLAYCADIPVNDAGPQAITSNASLGASCSGLIGQSTAYFVLSGTAGPLDATVVNGTNPTDSAVIYDKSGTTHAQPFTPTAGVYYRVYPVGSGTKVSIIPDSTWGAQSASVDIRCTAATEGFPPSTSGGGGGNSTIVAPTNCGPNTAVCTYDVHSLLPTVTPGGALAAVPVNASAVPYSPTNPLPVTTPAPVGTIGVVQQAACAVAYPCGYPTPAPLATTPVTLPTVSPGLQAGFTEVAPSSTPGTINGANVGVINLKGSRSTYICDKSNTTCADALSGAQANILEAGLVPINSPTELSAASGTCTTLQNVATIITSIYYASATAQTGTLTLYNEGASPTCSAADTIYVSVAHGLSSSPDVLYMFCGTGVAYKWTTAAESGRVLLGYL